MKKRLYKSTANKIFTGTCGGIGEYFDIDPTFIRLLFVILFFLGSWGFWIYLVGALIIPKSPPEDFNDFQDIKNSNPQYKQKPKQKNKIASNDDEDDEDEFDSYFEK